MSIYDSTYIHTTRFKVRIRQKLGRPTAMDTELHVIQNIYDEEEDDLDLENTVLLYNFLDLHPFHNIKYKIDSLYTIVIIKSCYKIYEQLLWT